MGEVARKDEAYQQVRKEVEQEAALPEGKCRRRIPAAAGAVDATPSGVS